MINPFEIIKMLSSNEGREKLANQMLSKLPSNTREFLLKYKNNPMKGIEEGVRQGKITQKEIQQLRPIFNKARLLGVKLPESKLKEIENLAKNQNNQVNNSNFRIFS